MRRSRDVLQRSGERGIVLSRWQNRKTSIYGRLGRLLLLAAAVGILAFLMLYAAGMSLIDRFAWDGNYLAREGQNRADSLQAYIEKNNVSTGDSDKLTVWVKSRRLSPYRYTRMVIWFTIPIIRMKYLIRMNMC